MTLIIDLDPETEARLDRAAAAQGINKEEYARRLLETKTLDPDALWFSRTPAERAEAVRQWAESHRRLATPIPDEALDRESIYEGCGE